jgi:predicted amidohydrolase
MSAVRAAAIQFDPQVGLENKDANVARGIELVNEAADNGANLVVLPEVDGVDMFDTAVLIGPDGYIGRYRKTHLWNREKLVFEPGNEGYPVFPTPIGRIGLLVCWDIWFPEP